MAMSFYLVPDLDLVGEISPFLIPQESAPTYSSDVYIFSLYIFNYRFDLHVSKGLDQNLDWESSMVQRLSLMNYDMKEMLTDWYWLQSNVLVSFPLKRI